MSAIAYTRSEGVLWRRAGDVVLVADVDADEVECLSAPTSIAWELLATPRTARELTTLLAAEFSTDPDEVSGHIERILAILAARGWLVEGSDDA